MPNWCSTTYKCIGDKNEVEELNSILHKMINRNEPVIENGFGTMWLGELVNELGKDYKKYPCRGSITDFYYDDEGMVTIYQETAWCEQECVRKAIEEKFTSIKVYYLDEECGNDYYQTNDPGGEFFPERYFLDGEDVCEYFESLEDVIEYLKDHYGIDIEENDDINDIIRKVDEYGIENEDDWLSLHEFQVID